jgi:predicted MPP superfamily phosphohydrolase
MAASTLRRAIFGRLFLTLALSLGLFQLLLWHWWRVVALGGEGPGALALACTGGLLVAGNGAVVPLMRRHRRRNDWAGRALRLYLSFGVATLLAGVLLAALWLLFLLPAGLVGAVGGDPRAAWGVFRGASIASVGALALLLLWGFTWGQARIEHTRVRFPVPGLAPELSGLRLAHVSDLHIGNHLDGARLERLVARVNGIGADAIVLTGDLFDFDPAFVEGGVRALARLHAPLGVYAILGNHDVYTGSERIADAFARLAPNLCLLRDEIVRLPAPAPLYLAGAEDPGRDWSARGLELPALDELAAARPHDGPTLLLVHRPQALSQAARLGFPLLLAGHTHGGQIALPTAGGRWNLARIVTPLTRGVYRLGGCTLYVNRGAGVGGPALRFNCPREIASVELV